MDESFLRDLIVVLSAALPIVVVGHRLRLPSIAGFLIAGMLIGPHGVGLVATTEHVESLAEFGIVLLLFVVGLELSFTQMVRQGVAIAGAGVLQISLTAAVTASAAALFGVAWPQAVFLGFLVAHSSTAIVLKLLADRGEIDAPHGRIAIGLLLIQDFSLVPMVLATRLLAEPEAGIASVGRALATATGAFLLIAVAARTVIPALLHRIVALRSRELFTGAIVLFCLGTAWTAEQFGLSLAVGALIAGLVISESDYSHQVFAEVLPFRDVLNGLFFVSVGMLVHLGQLVTGLPIWVAAAGALLLLKFSIVALLVAPVARSRRVAIMSAASLASGGEMAFVLAGVGVPLGLMTQPHYESFVAVAVLTMLAAPFLIAAGPRLSTLFFDRDSAGTGSASLGKSPLTDHVVVVGYGLNGENLSRVLRETDLPHVVLELHPERLAAARAHGEEVIFGDATRRDVLRHVRIDHAAVVVIAISDPSATRRIVSTARAIAPEVPIIVRTRYVAEIDGLLRLGATEVIPEEFETSIEIFARVLRRLHVPRNVIDLQVDLIRQEGYGMLRGDGGRSALTHLDALLAAALTDTVLVTGDSPATGRTIGELDLRAATGVTIIAVVRNGKPFTNPGAEFAIEANDVVVLVGGHAQLSAAQQLLMPSA